KGILKKGSRGVQVKKIQEKIGVKVDGIFGILTEKAVKEFQRKNDLVVDGIVGVKTWGKLFNPTNL
ncbi:peptidoglycan-binding domain-containing protein, partial [Gottfriedia acidiceleris]